MKILSIFWISTFLLCLSQAIHAQSATKSNREMAIEALAGLDQDYVVSGILYDRIPQQARLQNFAATDISSALHWIQGHSELYDASLNTNYRLKPESLTNLISYSVSVSNIIPVGVIMARFEQLNPDAINIEGNGVVQLKSGYQQSQAFVGRQSTVASLLSESIPKGTNQFILPEWAIFSNLGVGISSVTVDFGEGNTPKQLVPGGGTVSATFSSEGTKIINYTIHKTDGTQQTARSQVVVGAERYIHPLSYLDPVSTVDSVRIQADIPFQGYDENIGFYGKGDLITYYAQGRSQIQKPIIVLDGFDPSQERWGGTIKNENLAFNSGTENLADFLRGVGGGYYDVQILNPPDYYMESATYTICDPGWDARMPLPTPSCREVTEWKLIRGGGDYVERNAMVLVKAIIRLNQQLQANGSTEKITIIGPSMGGLISRYALAYMEKNGMNHNCKLWVSFDSPHNGANLPISLQNLLTGIKDKLGAVEAKQALDEKINSPAAKQMLIYHHLGSNSQTLAGAPGFRDRFVQVLNNIGFPEAACLRKVAMNNGSKTGVFQNSTPGAQALYVTAKASNLATSGCYHVIAGLPYAGPWFVPICTVAQLLQLQLRTYNMVSDQSTFKSSEVKLVNAFNGTTERYLKGTGKPSIDLIPGAYFDFYGLILEGITKLNGFLVDVNVNTKFATPNFIPSFSSYALKNPDSMWGSSLTGVSIQSDTPFDALYAPDQNEEHTLLTGANVTFFLQQLALADSQCPTNTNNGPLNNGCYQIKAKHSGKLLQPENDGNGARVRQYSGSGQSNQVFHLESQGDNTYKVTSQSSSKVLKLQSSAQNGTAVVTGDWTGSTDQKWVFAVKDNTYYEIATSANTSYALDVEGVSTNDGAGLHVWGVHNGDNQRFEVISTACSTTPPPTPCNFTEKGVVGSWNGQQVQTRQYTANNTSGWYLVTVVSGSSVDKHFVRGANFADRTDVSWSVVVNKSCLSGGDTGWGGFSKPDPLSAPSGYVQLSEPDGAIYFQTGTNPCSPPGSPLLSANDNPISSGQSTTLYASNCSGTVNWSTGATGGQVTVSPSATTTYTATCSANGCTSSSASITVVVITSNPNPCGFTEKGIVGSWNGFQVQTRQFSSNGVTGWYLVTAVPGSSADKHFVRGANFDELGQVSWSTSINTSCLSGGSTGWWGRSKPDPLTTPPGYVQLSEPDGALYFQLNSARLQGSEAKQKMTTYGPKAWNEEVIEHLTVEPNPSSGNITVRFVLDQGTEAVLSIADYGGREWYRKSVRGKVVNSEEIKLHHAPPGIYMILLRKSDGVSYKKLLLVK